MRIPVPVDSRTDAIAREIVDSAVKVHKTFGPGLLERTYQLCLAQELSLRGLAVRLEVPQPVVYEAYNSKAAIELTSWLRKRLLLKSRLLTFSTRSTRHKCLPI